jgi:hypothetical protein
MSRTMRRAFGIGCVLVAVSAGPGSSARQSPSRSFSSISELVTSHADWVQGLAPASS